MLLISEEIKKYTSELEIYQTKKPDIVFRNKVEQEINLEIETGIEFDKHQERLNEKFAQLYKTSKGRTYIILTNRSIIKRYKRFRLPILQKSQIKEFIKQQFSGQLNSVIGTRFCLVNK